MELEQYSWIRKPTRNKITLFLYGIGADSSIFTNDSFNLITLFLYGIGAITNIEYGSIFNYYIIPIWNWSPQSSRASGNLTELHYSYMELELLPWVLKTSSLHSLHYSYMELELFPTGDNLNLFSLNYIIPIWNWSSYIKSSSADATGYYIIPIWKWGG